MEQCTSSQSELLNSEPQANQSSESLEQSADITTLQELLSDRYHIIRKLGKGAQGCVYLAESQKTHQKVAIKQLLIQSVKDWKQYDLFQREASVLAKIAIPGVAKLHETIEMLDIPTPMALIVQDYIDGDPLQTFIAKGHRFQIDQIGDILLQMLDILEKLHHDNPPVIHRDIKPSNMVLNYVEHQSTPEVHLIDFGAVSNPQVKGGGSTVVGTYGYMAPEQLMGRASASSDLYSLAIVAVYLLSGVAPENLEIQDYHVLIDPHLQHLPHKITAFLRKMLEPRAEDRLCDYRKIRQFFNALKSQNFDDIPEVSALPEKGKYDLDKVFSYHQPGNIVLWQELSDATPRKVPKSKHFKTEFPNKILYFLPLFAIIICNAASQFQDNGNLGIILNTSGLILMWAFFIILVQKIKRPKSSKANNAFVRCARKSMATVTRIEYIPIYPQMRSDESLADSYTPTWRITYSFNPPDDSSPDNLVRSVKTHTLPDIKEGDLIPILYLIQNDKNGEHVFSSPYPVPVSDKFSPSEG